MSTATPRLVSIIAAAAILSTATASHAATVMPGWQTTLSTLFHDVSGTVTVVDADTFTVENFIYDGEGPSVYFYLGADESDPSFLNGLRTGPLLTGTVFDGTQATMTIDLPGAETFDGYEAISVWCDDFNVSFGQGTFAPVPEPSSALLIGIAALVFLRTRRK